MKKTLIFAILAISILTSGLANAGSNYRRLRFRPLVSSFTLINVFENPSARDNATAVLLNIIKQVEPRCRVSSYNDQNSTYDGGSNNFWSEVVADCPKESAHFLKTNIQLKADDLRFLRRDIRTQRLTLINVNSNAGDFSIEVNNRDQDQESHDTVVISKKNYKYVPKELRGQPVTAEAIEIIRSSFEQSK